MKTLKFRAWEFEANEFIYLDPKEGFDTVWLLDDEQSVCHQFTGLKDKNGKEIYEGDIVYAKANNARYMVEHGLYINTKIDGDGENPDCYGWYLKRIKEEPPVYGESLDGAEECLEVIGNIYENPELLNNK